MTRERFDDPGGTFLYGDDPEKLGDQSRIVTSKGNFGQNGPDEVRSVGVDEQGRLASLGHAAAKRQAYQIDYSKAAGQIAESNKDRDEQMRASAALHQQAMGMTPSAAAIRGGAVADRSLAASMQEAASARGMGQASAMQQGAMRMQAGQLAAARGAVGARADETSGARSQYGSAIGDIRSGDLRQQGLAMGMTEAQARSEMGQRGLNYGAQSQYNDMGLRLEDDRMAVYLRQRQIEQQIRNMQQAKSDAEERRAKAVYAAGANAAGSLIGDPSLGDQSMAAGNASGGGSAGDQRDVDTSDVRAKENVQRPDIGPSLAEGLAPYSYEYKPSYQRQAGQSPGERNIGPMAQDMASNPITATAVGRDDDGMLYIDRGKATKLALGGLGHVAAKQQKMEADIAAMKRGK